MAALVRFRFPTEDFKMSFTMDLAVMRFWEETQMADWIIWRGVGFGGRRLD